LGSQAGSVLPDGGVTAALFAMGESTAEGTVPVSV
jgi:hypothetical protein